MSIAKQIESSVFNAADIFKPNFIDRPLAEIRQLISLVYQYDESQWLKQLLDVARPDQHQLKQITDRTTQLVIDVRKRDDAIHMIDALLLQYSLDTKEGILLMCLAEALLRIPDNQTADALIRDKLGAADWRQHLSQSDSLLVNASTWGLMLSGKIVKVDRKEDGTADGVISKLVSKMGEPMLRQAINQSMKIMGQHFVLAPAIDLALKRGKSYRDKGYTYSFDMLGESALTKADADRYLTDYLKAIEMVAADKTGNGQQPRPTISIKLSALHPRYEVGQRKRVMSELFDSVITLIKKARPLGVGITMDAEEADRQEIFLDLFQKLYQDPAAKGWGNFGLVVQSYNKQALPILGWLAALAKQQGDRIPLRLVKGAYWDAEIKHCQQLGLSSYPVYTRKESTDLAYLACAKFLLSQPVQNLIYSQFASHNAHTVASVLSMAGDFRDFEFQRLHGMGDGLYNTVLEQEKVNIRIYAPVGSHKDLLPYLVRRLLENGANSSFVHRLVDANTPVNTLTVHPAQRLDQLVEQNLPLNNEQIPMAQDLFSDRKNSLGVNIEIESQWHSFKQKVDQFLTAAPISKGPIINGQMVSGGETVSVECPWNPSRPVGRLTYATTEQIEQAITIASNASQSWNFTPVAHRAALLNKLADALEDNLHELVAICHLEAGKTIQDGIDEVREAVDFCRYYANQAIEKFAPISLPGPTGESNELYLTGRGVFGCISPWNFPLAIFLGQVTAALAAGNCVVAKPAEQTSLVAVRAVELMQQVGFPAGVIQLLPGTGAEVGARLSSDDRINGLAFTGSTATAKAINLAIAQREGAIVPLVAETGGQNAMIVDSTALPEQVVRDAIDSAFASAGQRCSALRVMFVQADIADRVIELLSGAMAQLKVGDPSLHSTDLGPVIDQRAFDGLQQHIQQMKTEAKLIAETPLDSSLQGHFVAPVAFEIDRISQLKKEHFGPILHLVRYQASELNQIIDSINNTGYGLTLGIHTRNEYTAQAIEKAARVGNSYINRNQIGAVVGVQPFGGQGLSGTGPKAGGPNYLTRFCVEKTCSINTTAAGGNADLLGLGSHD
ncbi:bifunctional proline dehydrogenase/L-glutamate gamma-semialdehyde dehydrogenase PutA [Pelagibaculum spongiae]|uniref:Bifunctional protein PutA n=1 Tax=Pelagibaculum spongiae TaxID=2080658 RepID=A0A2V1H4Q7_9GAMM|nr:bifunctional proline dehydrogenase/L-glutamate gamma-semialdehyde dehydrogenase PutA [Pelagibaculum spongiae]PVZ72208.1 bifunctional proline dehydrogenase/L-glutamate gamma-semialdehyde dehydrogenase [Pelagibaculum spongiae]